MYAWAKCSSTPSNPAASARRAAPANSPGNTLGRSRIWGSSVSVTRSRSPNRRASSSRSLRYRGHCSSGNRASASLICFVRSRQQRPVPVGEDEELAEVPRGLGPPANPQEVDDLDEEPGPPAARPPHGAHQLGEARDEPVVADPKQRSARDVANAGGLDYERTGLTARESLVPGQHLRRDQPILGSAPRHHRRDPGALLQVEPADAQRAEPERARRLLRGRRAGRGDLVLDEGLGMPHAARS